jgi:DNA-binding winged helix-turn-helix (wHTH) protein
LESAFIATKYWVGDFFIDLTRNQITKKNQSRTIPPKALAVLTCLAKNSNKVVSHDDLLSEVWPNTVVTPNTLQRSIAQLRKVLGEDSQIHSYIKTHAKQGYSLEVEVRWQDKTDDKLLAEQTETLIDKTTDNVVEKLEGSVTEFQVKKTSSSRSYIGLTTLLTGIIFLSFFGIKYLSTAQDFTFSVGEIRSLTATDNKELGAIYSPDGKYIVFLRYSEEVCINSNVWAKNIETQQEIQLTKNMGRYGRPSLSPDGKKIVFIKSENCNKSSTSKNCYKLMQLDFDAALSSPQSPSELLECQNSRISGPTWLNNNNIALFQKTSFHWKLVSYSVTENKSEVIYEIEDGNLINYDYSAKDNVIALVSTHNDGKNYIEKLQVDGVVLSSHQIEYPPEITNLYAIYPNFTPISDQLAFSTGRQLFNLSFKGEVTKIKLPLDEPISSPIFHPSGKRMLVTKGVWDSDIATLPLSQIKELQIIQPHEAQANTQKSDELSIIDRSTVEEENAMYQPRGDLIAFKSNRSGIGQVYIYNGNNAKQLTNFPIDTYIRGLDWAADGQSILVSANNILTQHNLDKSHKFFQFEHAIKQLFQWNSEDNTALVNTVINGRLKFGELNLNNLTFKAITDNTVNWALKTEDGRLIYTDHMDQFWQPGPAEDQLITSLENHGSDTRFIIKDNVIYGVNKEFKLWSYDLRKSTFKTLGNMPKNINYLTDINQTDTLLSIRVKTKKEVAELILND